MDNDPSRKDSSPDKKSTPPVLQIRSLPEQAMKTASTHPAFSAAREVIRIMGEHGGTALIVGGAVRDLILNRKIRDLDLAADMNPAEISERFKTYPVGKSRDFKTLCIVHQGHHFETTSFRGLNNKTVWPATMQDQTRLVFSRDAMHRDFTINAMALDRDLNLIDPWEGLMDLKSGLIRGVQDPGARILEDELRMLRAVRLAAELGLNLEQETAAAIKKHAQMISKAAPERISRELIKAASLPGCGFAQSIRLMDDLGLLEHLLPEITALKNLPHDPRHHPEGDVFAHTLRAIEVNTEADPVLNMALLVHDAGKAETIRFKQGQATYPGHARAGEKLAASLGERLRLSREMILAVQTVTALHMHMHSLHLMRTSKILELMENPFWGLLVNAARCDQAARGRKNLLELEKNLARARDRVREWVDEKNGCIKPVITGRQVLEHTGIKPGPLVGTIIRKTTVWARDNHIRDESMILKHALHLARMLSRDNGQDSALSGTDHGHNQP